MLHYPDYIFGIWTGFVIACAYYEIVWWLNGVRAKSNVKR